MVTALANVVGWRGRRVQARLNPSPHLPEDVCLFNLHALEKAVLDPTGENLTLEKILRLVWSSLEWHL